MFHNNAFNAHTAEETIYTQCRAEQHRQAAHAEILAKRMQKAAGIPHPDDFEEQREASTELRPGYSEPSANGTSQKRVGTGDVYEPRNLKLAPSSVTRGREQQASPT